MMVGPDVVEWKDYEMKAGVRYPEVFSQYKGLMFDWKRRSIDRTLTIPALVDMMLYADNDDRTYLSQFLNDSSMKYESVKDKIIGLTDIEMEIASQKIVENIWSGNHHWGKLFNTPMSDETFVEEYLFRFIFNMRFESNAIDNDEWLDDGYQIYTLREIYEPYGKRITKDGEKFDQYIIRKGLDVQHALEGLKHGLFINNRQLGSAPDLDCMEAVEIVLRNVKERTGTGIFGGWKDILDYASHMGDVIVYSGFEDMFIISEEDLEEEEILDPNKRKSLGDYAVSAVSTRLAELFGEWKEDAVKATAKR